jgi:hypothetical protein
MSDFCGIEPGAIPSFAEAGTGRFMSVGSLPEHTTPVFFSTIRGMPLAWAATNSSWVADWPVSGKT